MIKLMDMVSILMLMDQSMKEIGKMIYNMVKVLKLGLMDLNILDSILMVRNKGKENMNGQMDHIMMVIGMIIKLQDLEHIIGLMVEVILDNG